MVTGICQSHKNRSFHHKTGNCVWLGLGEEAKTTEWLLFFTYPSIPRLLEEFWDDVGLQDSSLPAFLSSSFPLHPINPHLLEAADG